MGFVSEARSKIVSMRIGLVEGFLSAYPTDPVETTRPFATILQTAPLNIPLRRHEEIILPAWVWIPI